MAKHSPYPVGRAVSIVNMQNQIVGGIVEFDGIIQKTDIHQIQCSME